MLFEFLPSCFIDESFTIGSSLTVSWFYQCNNLPQGMSARPIPLWRDAYSPNRKRNQALRTEQVLLYLLKGRKRDSDWTWQWNFRHVCKILVKGEQEIMTCFVSFVREMRWEEQSSESLCNSLPLEFRGATHALTRYVRARSQITWNSLASFLKGWQNWFVNGFTFCKSRRG